MKCLAHFLVHSQNSTLTVFDPSGGLGGALPTRPFLCTLEPAGTALASHRGPQAAQPMWHFLGRIWHSWPTGPLLWDGQAVASGVSQGLRSVIPAATGTARTLGSNLLGDRASLPHSPGEWELASVPRRTPPGPPGPGDPNPKPGWASTCETLNLPRGFPEFRLLNSETSMKIPTTFRGMW